MVQGTAALAASGAVTALPAQRVSGRPTITLTATGLATVTLHGWANDRTDAVRTWAVKTVPAA